MIAAALETLKKEVPVANRPAITHPEPVRRFEPVSRILERCDEISLEVARPVTTQKANS